MLNKSSRFKDKFKQAYAISLVGQLGFYIAIPFIVAIAGHNYLDKYILDKYFISTHHTIHIILDCMLAIGVGIFSIWQIYKLMKPFLDDK